jgi:hypothetical protein
MKRFRPKLTYANVMSTVAAFLALTGGATAIAMSSLPKNSVKAKQIAKNAVTAPKIAKEAVTEAKIGKEAVTGPKVKVSTLPKVPAAVKADSATSAGTAANATHADSATHADTAGHADSAGTADTATTANSANALAGTPASAFLKEQTASTESFPGETFEISVPGYGSFGFRCHSGTHILGFLDFPSVSGPLQGGLISAQEVPIEEPELFTISGTAGGGEYGTQGKIIHVQYELTVAGTSKTLLIQAAGFATGSGCAAQIHAYTTS